MLQSLHRIIAVLAMFISIALPAMAQLDPPARVGRLAHFENEVNFRVDRNDQNGPATLNWPISSGTMLETGERGRAEAWIGSTAYRLAEDSQIEFSTVDDARVDLNLNHGSLSVSILDGDQVDGLIVATPDGNIRFLAPGRYRIDVLADRSELTVQAGRAVFENARQATPVSAGQKLSRWSDGGEQLDADRDRDAFDRWVANRENITLAGTARRYVSPHMTGYQDLDAYGDWQTAPDYGAVWYPRGVASDWAPYRDGRWAWVAPWGWTWIDRAPWGFAPFHYGRWAIIHGRWAWVPGQLAGRPVYAPALVGWIGNAGWNVGFSFGTAPAVGWFPLAPREVYVPGHRHSDRYVHQLNLGHVRDLRLIERAQRDGARAPFAHHASPRAVTVVPANLLREGRPISAGEMRHPERPELGRAPLARRAPTADWLAPAPGAVRPHGEAQREPFNRQPRRDFEAPRQNVPERGMARPDSPMRPPERPAFRQPQPETGDARRGWPEPRPGFESRGRVPDAMPQRREAVPAEIRPATPDMGNTAPPDNRRGNFRRPDAQPGSERNDNFPPPIRREQPAPEMRAPQPVPARTPMPARDDAMRPRSPELAPAPLRREQPLPEVRAEERQPRPMMTPQEREQRREMRDFQRMERPAPMPRERETPPIMRQPEMQRPAEVRMPAPVVRDMPQPRVEPMRQPAPEFRAPAAMPQRVEPPRAPMPEIRAPAPAPMAQPRMDNPNPPPARGASNEPGRRHGKDDERGPR